MSIGEMCVCGSGPWSFSVFDFKKSGGDPVESTENIRVNIINPDWNIFVYHATFTAHIHTLLAPVQSALVHQLLSRAVQAETI